MPAVEEGPIQPLLWTYDNAVIFNPHSRQNVNIKRTLVIVNSRLRLMDVAGRSMNVDVRPIPVPIPVIPFNDVNQIRGAIHVVVADSCNHAVYARGRRTCSQRRASARGSSPGAYSRNEIVIAGDKRSVGADRA